MTDTNQASEDELRTLDEILSQAFTDGSSDTMWQNDKHVEIFATAKKELLAIIRTEKLKLLAEVRERVVGEDERIDIQSDYDKLDVPHLETDKYPGLDGVRQASRNLCRARQRAEIDKLEAELLLGHFLKMLADKLEYGGDKIMGIKKESK